MPFDCMRRCLHDSQRYYYQYSRENSSKLVRIRQRVSAKYDKNERRTEKRTGDYTTHSDIDDIDDHFPPRLGDEQRCDGADDVRRVDHFDRSKNKMIDPSNKIWV